VVTDLPHSHQTIEHHSARFNASAQTLNICPGRHGIRQASGLVGIKPDLIAIAAAFCQFSEDAPEDAHLAPADEKIMDILVWPIVCGRRLTIANCCGS
jgi:hypothetical protein